MQYCNETISLVVAHYFIGLFFSDFIITELALFTNLIIAYVLLIHADNHLTLRYVFVFICDLLILSFSFYYVYYCCLHRFLKLSKILAWEIYFLFLFTRNALWDWLISTTQVETSESPCPELTRDIPSVNSGLNVNFGHNIYIIYYYVVMT